LLTAITLFLSFKTRACTIACNESKYLAVHTFFVAYLGCVLIPFGVLLNLDEPEVILAVEVTMIEIIDCVNTN